MQVCMGEKIYQKESIREKSIRKRSPTNPTSSSPPRSQDLGSKECDDDAHKLVPGIRHQIEQLRIIADAENIHGHLETYNLKHNDRNGRRGDGPKQFRVETAPESRQHGRKKNVRDQGHDGDVHVRGIQVIARREEHGRVLLLDQLATGTG